MKFFKNPKWIAVIILFSISVGGLFLLKRWVDKKADVSSSSIALETAGSETFEKDGVKYLEANWKELVLLDYKTGERGGDLRRYENQMVRIPGYIVPLTDEV